MRNAHIATLFVCLFSAASARAGFVVSISSGTAAAGAPSQLAVTVTSDAPGGELLDVFGLELRITRVSGTGELRFVDPQSSAELSRLNYVFGADSANGSVPGANARITTTATFDDTYLGGDGTLSGTGVTVGSATQLLAILDLDTSSAVAGDRYQLSVIGSGLTFFYDPSLTESGWSAGAGTLDIRDGSGITPAPAPSGAALTLSGVAFLIALAWFRRPLSAAA